MADKKTENRNIDTAKARGELEEDLLEYVYRKWRQGRQITSKEYARTTGITTSEVLFLYKKYPVNSSLCVEVMVVKKKVTIAFVIIGILAISTMIIFSTYKSSEAYRKAKAKTQWECSVVCAEKSTPDSYVITYSDAKILSNTGVLTVQNRNDFDITVHLLCEGKQELVSDSIPAGGCYSFQNVTDKEYTVGIHAEVDENTDIKAFVYDGKDTEPYTR